MFKEQLSNFPSTEQERIYLWLKENKGKYTINVNGGIILKPEYAKERLYNVLEQIKNVKF